MQREGKKDKKKRKFGVQDKKNEKVFEKNELLKSQLARTLADYDNLTKRVEREREEFSTLVKARFVRSFLPVLDMLYDANSHLGDQGLAIAIQTTEQVLRDEGVVKIDTKVGDIFNEDLNEAVEAVSKKSKRSGEILEILLTGWKIINGPIIRPAKVKVNNK